MPGKHTNVHAKFLGGSRKVPKPGDLFITVLPQVGTIFGRVIRDDVPFHMAAMWLLYFYDHIGKDETDRPPLAPPQLLVPPSITNRLGWVRGYYKTIDHIPLEPDQQLRIHSFRTRNGLAENEKGQMVKAKYCNEEHRPLKKGQHFSDYWGLESFVTIEYGICKELGIPPAFEYEPTEGDPDPASRKMPWWK